MDNELKTQAEIRAYLEGVEINSREELIKCMQAIINWLQISIDEVEASELAGANEAAKYFKEIKELWETQIGMIPMMTDAMYEIMLEGVQDLAKNIIQTD